jgi:hypothetical protein
MHHSIGKNQYLKICPGWVITALSQMVSEGQRPSLFMPDAQRLARSAIRTIGNAAETTGYIGHQIQVSIYLLQCPKNCEFQREMFGCFPQFMANFALKRQAEKIRTDWLKKANPLGKA